MNSTLRVDLQELVDRYKKIQSHLNDKLNESGPVYSKNAVAEQYDAISHMIGRLEDRLKSKDNNMLDITILTLIQKLERWCEEENTSSNRERSKIWEMAILDMTRIRTECRESRLGTRQIVVRKV